MDYKEHFWVFYFTVGTEEVESVVCLALRLELEISGICFLLARREGRMIPGYTYYFSNNPYRRFDICPIWEHALGE
jgi:hypothetical protein